VTKNTETKYNYALRLKKLNPAWPIKKCCERAKISVPSFYEAKKEIAGDSVTRTTTTAKMNQPLWKRVVHSNLTADTKLEILSSL